MDELQLPDDTFRLQLAPELPLIKADASQLQRAFVNLLGNSARYSGGHPGAGARERAAQPHHGAGRGPRARHPARAAGARVRALLPAGTDRTGHRGSGLGLAIVRGFVEANGGRVWVESLPHQGTTFALELPLEQPTDAGRPRTRRLRAGSRT